MKKLLALAVFILSFSLIAEDSASLPDPDGKPADMSKPVKVFILLGQSNMVGAGAISPGKKGGPEKSLENAVKEQSLYPFLIDDKGNWTVRKDVRYVRSMGSGASIGSILINDWMSIEGLTKDRKTKSIGPEFGIGHVLGNTLDEPVMVLKSCIGNRSLGWDLLPPGTTRYSHDGVESPGYKETYKSKKDKTIVPWVKDGDCMGWYAGCQYDGDINSAKKILENIGEYYPGATKYEVAGFFYWQGDKDRYNEVHAANYEKNLMALIASLRKDFNAPKAKFVCATLGQTEKGSDKNKNEALILNAKLNVDGESGKYSENKGNVATVYTNPISKGGASSGHYNSDSRTYMDVGLAMGSAMAELLKK